MKTIFQDLISALSWVWSLVYHVVDLDTLEQNIFVQFQCLSVTFDPCAVNVTGRHMCTPGQAGESTYGSIC